MVIVHLLDLKMIFLKWVFFNLRIWLIFKETHWRDLHHFHSVLIDFITTSEKKDIRWLFRFRNPKPKTTNHLPGQHTVQANIQYDQTFKRFKLFEKLSFYCMLVQSEDLIWKVSSLQIPGPHRTRTKKSRFNSHRLVRGSLTMWLTSDSLKIV